MNFKNILFIALLICYFSLAFSCKKEKRDMLFEEKPLGLIMSKRIEFIINFPDTVHLGKEYKGEILYKSLLDTITSTFDDQHNIRYVRFIMLVNNNVDYDDDYLKLIVKDTFGAIDNRKILFYGVKFDKLGEYYIDGLINDLVLIDTMTKYNKRTDKLRLIENEERVTHKVVVIE